MKTTTAVVAVGWLVVSMITLAAGVVNYSLWGREMLAGLCWSLLWGFAGLVGAVALLARRPLGWWVLTSVNALLVAMWAWGIASTYGVHRQDIEAVQDLLGAVIMIFLVLSLVALLVDRPSRWRTAVSGAEAES